MAAVREVLGEIGAAALPEVLALNKWDLLDTRDRTRVRRRHPEGVPVSALTGWGVDELGIVLEERIPAPPIEVHLLVPFDRPDVVPRLYRRGQVVSVEEGEDGTSVVARIPPSELPRVQDLVVQTPRARARA